MSEQLKPCPFCGGKPIKEKARLDERFGYAETVTYRCVGCGCTRSARGDDSNGGYADNTKVEKNALEAWNRRANLGND